MGKGSSPTVRGGVAAQDRGNKRAAEKVWCDMTIAQSEGSTSQKPLRLWPGVVVVVLQWLSWLLVPFLFPDAAFFGVIAGILGWFIVLLWWLFFSRAPWSERVGAILLMVVALLATSRLVHQSIANGMMGMMLTMYAAPVLSLALVAWAAASRNLPIKLRFASMAGAILLACGVFTLLRTGGISGNAVSDFHWRWTPSPEERLLARSGDEPAALPSPPPTAETPGNPIPKQVGAEPAVSPLPAASTEAAVKGSPTPSVAESTAVPASAKTSANWPSFRGPARDGVTHGVRIETDWSKTPPVQLWRRPIGPGWSSFAVRGDLIYTQEQRGDEEIVSCYNLSTGEPVWRHKNAARFWESNGGAGPRATPTINGSRVYTFGGTGIVNALDARNGAVIWSRNAATDANVKVPDWGFASSPLVVGDGVIVAAAGSLIAYDLADGKQRWLGPAGGSGYSSPQLATIDGIAQVLLHNGAGAISVAPADGKVLWKYEWSSDGIVQPALTADRNVLIGAGAGMRRVGITHGPDGWSVNERWASNGLKPYFNDFVVHKGYAYGFDGSILACIDLKDGKRKWKGGRYGHGQMVLLPEQDLLLALSEEGELALVAASPDQFTEIARIPAIEGKTWNHPALAGDVLLVRNGQEMAAFRLTLASR
jgi:outer membrane protein assembly factor BamB